MKKIITLIFVAQLHFLFGQEAKQFQLGTNIFFDFPIKSTMPYMGVNGGVGLQFAYSPMPRTPFYIEFKPSWGVYSMRSLDQTFVFSDGSQTQTTVDYSSAMSKYILGFKYMLGPEYKRCRGFVTPQIGAAKLKSRIVIQDPEDEDGCKPLDSRTAIKDWGWVYGGEAGIDLDLNLFRKKVEQGNVHLFAAINYLRGFRHFKYTNVKYMQDAPHDTNVQHDDRDINVQFVNLTTNEIHEHKVGEVYHTALEMVGFNIGVKVNF